MHTISTWGSCKSLRLQRLAIALLLIAAITVHTRILANFQSELWRREAAHAYLSIPIVPIETHDVVSDAPFYFSACLLSKDDNKILPEWLAYHYEVLPLRRLIIATDPYSVTSPVHIIDAYRRHLGMNITLWRDRDYMYAGRKSWQKPMYSFNATLADRYKGHLWRQVLFYTKCARELKQEGRTHLVIMDSDEYLSFNFFPPSALNSTRFRPCKGVEMDGVGCRDDGLPVEMVRFFNLEFPHQLGANQSTIAHFIGNQWSDIVYDSRRQSRVCEVAPRVVVGASESTPPVNTLPQEFDWRVFRTLRYRQHSDINSSLPGNVLMNLQNWRPQPGKFEPHRGPGSCFNAGKRKRPDASASFFRVHHYTGSLEEFLSRPGDGTRTALNFEKRNNYSISGQVDEVVGWLESFIQRVGPRRALYLTQGLREWAFQNDVEAFESHKTVAI